MTGLPRSVQITLRGGGPMLSVALKERVFVSPAAATVVFSTPPPRRAAA